MQTKGRSHQRVTQICMYKEEKKGWGGGGNFYKIRRHIPMNSASWSTLSFSSESETLFFMVGSSSGSSRTSSDPLEKKSASGPRVAELGMEERVTTKEERVTSGDNERCDKRSNLGLSSNRRNGSLLGSKCLGRNGSSLTNPLRMSTLIYGYWLSGRDRSLSRNSLCNSRSGKSYGLKHHISPIKETFHGCTHRGGNLLSCEVIYGDRLRLGLGNQKKKRGKMRKKGMHNR